MPKPRLAAVGLGLVLLGSPPASAQGIAPHESDLAALPVALPLPPVPPSAAERRAAVAAALRTAARQAGFDPALLVAIATVESGLDDGAANPRSSATGPLQFTAGTWSLAIARFGEGLPEIEDARSRIAALGAALGELARRPRPNRAEARAIEAERRDVQAALRAEEAALLALRRHPEVAGRLAARLSQDDAARLRALTGRLPEGPGDIYALHFLGIGAAAALLDAARRAPARSVAELLPPAVLEGNREIFHDAAGKPLGARAARSRIAARIEAALRPAEVQMAEAQMAEGESAAAQEPPEAR